MLTGIATFLATKLWGRWLLAIARFIGKVVRWIVSDWRHALIAILSLVAAYWYLDAGKAHKHADKAVAALERANKTIADMKAASEAAERAQLAMNAKRTQDEKDIANEADKDHRIAQLEASLASADYARRNRVRTICPSFTGQADTAATDSVAENRDGPSADAIMVSQADFDILTRNTVRLQSVSQWGAGLIEKGIAEGVD